MPRQLFPPLDQKLALRADHWSGGVARVATRLGLQAKSFDLAAAGFSDAVGRSISGDSVARLTEDWGSRVAEQRSAEAELANRPGRRGERLAQRRLPEVAPITTQASISTDGAMLLAVLFIYMVLASQFGSFIQPLIIMLALPLAAIGGLLALLVFRLNLDMTAMIGLILLFGLVTKNSILLVDLTNKMRRQRGMDILQALKTAGPIRLRPILMTTLALILGMLPVAIGLGAGSSVRQPMAITVIGGLITSTLLTLLLVPTAYSLVEGALARFQRSREARAAAKAAAAAAKEHAKESAAV